MKLNYFNFKQFGNHYLMTNDMGYFTFVSADEFKNIIQANIDETSELYNRLIDKKMIYDCSDYEFSAMHRYDVRQLKNQVNTSTALHIFVVTTACNMNCIYCQANRGTKHVPIYMTEEIAEKAVDIALQSPTINLDFEFQGGEPLLNFKIVKHIVEYAEIRKGNRNISYNIVSNLTLLSDEILDFLVKYNFGISTSLDGGMMLHDCNRPMLNGASSFEYILRGIEKIKQRNLRVGAIQTTTRHSFKYSKEIVNTYCDLGFDSIFIRPLTPLGKAAVDWGKVGYSTEEFLDFYKEIFEELISINRRGTYIRENHASILLSRINGEYVNYMELRSPCGAGIGQLAYYADGNIFTCDEGRMLSEMGDNTFCLGNVFKSKYCDLIDNGVCKTVCASSILESIPSCCDCVYQPYCGTCPVVNYALERDIIEKQPHGYRCRIYTGMLDLIFSKYKDDDREVVEILNSWSN